MPAIARSCSVARTTDATTVVTIFVNPRQFGDVRPRAAIRATRRATWRSARRRAWTSSGRRRSTRSIRRASIPPSRSARSPSRSRAPPGRATSRAWRRSSRSCSPGRRGARVLRPEGRAAGMVIRRMARDLALPPGRRVSDGAGAGWPRALVAQRPPAPSSAPPRRSSTGRDRGPRALGRRRAVGERLASIMRSVLAAEPLADR